MSKIVLTNEGATPPAPGVSSVILYAQGNALFSINHLGVVTALGGGGGSITINTAAPVTGGGTGSLFNLAVTVGTIAGTVAAGDDPRITGAVPNTLTIQGTEPIAVNNVFTPQALNSNLTFKFSFTGETSGDLPFRGATAWARLPVGTPNQVLTVVGGLPTWATPPVTTPYTYLLLRVGMYLTDPTKPANTVEQPGGNTWYPGEHVTTGSRTVKFRAVFGNDDGVTPVRVALFSVNDMAYVANLDGANPYISTIFQSGSPSGLIPLVSPDLRVGHAPFVPGTEKLYEVHVWSTVAGKKAILHKAELIVGL